MQCGCHRFAVQSTTISGDYSWNRTSNYAGKHMVTTLQVSPRWIPDVNYIIFRRNTAAIGRMWIQFFCHVLAVYTRRKPWLHSQWQHALSRINCTVLKTLHHRKIYKMYSLWLQYKPLNYGEDTVIILPMWMCCDPNVTAVKIYLCATTTTLTTTNHYYRRRATTIRSIQQ